MDVASSDCLPATLPVQASAGSCSVCHQADNLIEVRLDAGSTDCGTVTMAERAIGSIRRDCLDHVVMFGELNLRHLLQCYADYYNQSRTHLSLARMRRAGSRYTALGALSGHQYLVA